MTIPNKKNKGQSINDWLDKVSTFIILPSGMNKVNPIS